MTSENFVLKERPKLITAMETKLLRNVSVGSVQKASSKFLDVLLIIMGVSILKLKYHENGMSLNIKERVYVLMSSVYNLYIVHHSDLNSTKITYSESHCLKITKFTSSHLFFHYIRIHRILIRVLVVLVIIFAFKLMLLRNKREA